MGWYQKSVGAAIADWRRVFVLLGLVAALFSGAASGAGEPQQALRKDGYKMGVFPYLAPRELEKMYAPIAADFAAATQREVLFMTNSTYEKFMASLDKQLYDIVFVQPFDYVAIADKHGYRPLVTRNKPLPAILVVNPDSEIQTVEDLRGKTIALPPSVAAISYMIKDYLKENGIDPTTGVTIEHHRSHASCMHNVMLGTADACGTAPPALRFFKNKMKTTLRIVAKTEGIPNSIFAVHPRVPDNERDKLMQRVTSWPETDSGKRLLKGVKVEAFVAAEDKDYNVVRDMAREFR